MELRPIGKSGLQVPKLCFGGNVFGWTADRERSFQLLDACVDSGLTFIDTADTYSTWVPGHQGGESEAIIGEWLKLRGNRDKLIIATKLGKPMPAGSGLSREYMFREVEASLQRLQTDYIDLYQSHEDDPKTPLEETLSAFSELVQQGKVRAIGASNYKGARLAEALGVSDANGFVRYECLQPHYNLYHRADYEQDLEAVVLEQGIAVIPYYSLASGFLSGKYRTQADTSKSPRGKAAAKMLNPRGTAILQALDEVAAERKATPAQIALAWLMARPSITAPIASATSVEQFFDLLASTRVELAQADLDHLDAASAYEPPTESI